MIRVSRVKRKKPGPKPLPPGERKVCIEVSLHQHEIDFARLIGGSASEGIRKALQAYRERTVDTTPSPPNS